jgi:hypothetical protein
VWPPPVAVAFVKRTLPKSVSDTVRHAPEVVHSDGASAIHSADDVSGVAIRRTFVTTVFRVTLRTCIVTVCPLTLTDAEIVSPGRTVSPIFTAAAGTSSYQAQ